MDLVEVPEAYWADWSGKQYGRPISLERPRTTKDVTALLGLCSTIGQAVAVQGGRTGVSGGAAPSDGELVLSLEKMNQVEEFDHNSGVIIVGAGTILEDVHRLVEASGWSLPIDLGSRGSCQIGGNIATNAGGSRVVKYGTMRSQVLGLEAVLADGTVLGPPNRLVKNNAGYSLASLLVGSEGTLGVVTRAALKLVPLPAARRTALLALSPDAALDSVLGGLRQSLTNALSAFEVMWPDFVEEGLRVSSSIKRLPNEFAGLRVVLLEVEGQSDTLLSSLLEDALGQGIESGVLVDVVISASERDTHNLWSLRESVGEIQQKIRPYAGFDLSLPTSQHDAYVLRAKEKLNSELPELSSYFFGHAGDDNLHCVAGPCIEPEVRTNVESILFGLLPAENSSVTAEHGIGRKSKQYLSLSRSCGDLQAMKSIKRALDPKNLLNPGRIFDL